MRCCSGSGGGRRAKALGSILRNAASVLIFGIAAVTIAGDLGLNLAPVLASAGVLGPGHRLRGRRTWCATSCPGSSCCWRTSTGWVT